MPPFVRPTRSPSSSSQLSALEERASSTLPRGRAGTLARCAPPGSRWRRSATRTRPPLTIERTSGSFAAVLSTHGLLHGTFEVIGASVEAIAAKLEPGGGFSRPSARFATRDSRRVWRSSVSFTLRWTATSAASPHAFFDEPRLRALLEGRFALESVEERNADEIAGDWAHREKPLRSSAHWFVHARKRD